MRIELSSYLKWYNFYMKSKTTHLLIITHETVSEKMAGPSIRAWELAKAIGEYGYFVTLATPYPTNRNADNVAITNYSWEDPESLAALIDQSDVVLATGPVLARVVDTLRSPIQKPVIVDTYYVPEIEEVMLCLTHQTPDFDPTPVYINEMQIYLHQGDFFICALEKQYDFWMGGLLSAGRINPINLKKTYNLDRLIGIVPMGIPNDPPQKLGNRLKGVIPGINLEDKVIYWGGGIWDWTDPMSLMEALQIILKERDDVRVVFGALNHYDEKIVPRMSMASRLMEWIQRENWFGRYVFFQDWIPYDERGSFLLEADLGVSLNQRTLESRYAIRARLLDYLWAGLPSVLTEGDDIASLLKDIGLATLVHPMDVKAVANGILTNLEDSSRRERCAEGVQKIGDRLQWHETVKPLLQFLENPYQAEDASESRIALSRLISTHLDWDDLRLENIALRDEILNLRNRKVVRAADKFGQTRNWLIEKIHGRPNSSK